MKANVTNLRKALKASAEAHKVQFKWWRNEGHMSLESESVPVLADVRMICEAFYGQAGMIEVNWGYTIVWLGEANFLPEVDEKKLYLALPYGTKLV